jgi:hypothetical protein
MPLEEAARRLAQQIEAASKSERFSVDAEAVGELRQRGYPGISSRLSRPGVLPRGYR